MIEQITELLKEQGQALEDLARVTKEFEVERDLIIDQISNINEQLGEVDLQSLVKPSYVLSPKINATEVLKDWLIANPFGLVSECLKYFEDNHPHVSQKYLNGHIRTVRSNMIHHWLNTNKEATIEQLQQHFSVFQPAIGLTQLRNTFAEWGRYKK